MLTYTMNFKVTVMVSAFSEVGIAVLCSGTA